MNEREEATFTAGGEQCAAWWYPANGSTPPGPVVVLAHGLSGTRRDRLGAFAERFAAAGFAALVFDHRGFGDSGGEPDLFSPARQLEDWAAAIAYTRSLPGTDPDRIVTFGSSMGGGNALAAAAADRRVAAAISQVPFLDIHTQAHRAPLPVRLRMLSAALRGGHLPAVGQPHEAAFINAPDGERGWRHVVAIGEDSRWRNRVSARWLLRRPFRPIRAARTLHCPWLVCVGGADQVAAPGPAIRAARRAPHAELRIYPGVDHFDIYDGPEHQALVADQLDFLDRHVGARRSPPVADTPSR
ncbi:alpha/beta hydrolase [Nocardia sp. NPDC057227]|uniref:alpha/beta hydrolase n=1 Tax=Nocardia sp. NPDC057227 TaxID=3346056 RepID=UPI00363A9839